MPREKIPVHGNINTVKQTKYRLSGIKDDHEDNMVNLTDDYERLTKQQIKCMYMYLYFITVFYTTK